MIYDNRGVFSSLTQATTVSTFTEVLHLLYFVYCTLLEYFPLLYTSAPLHLLYLTVVAACMTSS